MKAIFKKRWFWITVLFLAINIAGLLKIISLLEGRPKPRVSIISTIEKKIRQFAWPFKKTTKDTIKDIEAKKDFKVESIRPQVYRLETTIYIDLSQDVDIDKIKGYIAVTPETDFYVEDSYYGIKLEGDFLPAEQRYTVEILKGMPSTKGMVLKETVKQVIVMPDYDPTFKFKAPGMYMSLTGNQILPIEVINVDKLEVKVHRVYDNNIVYLLNNMTSYRIPSDIGLDVIEEQINTTGERNKAKEVLIDLREILSDDSRGLFFMTINTPDGYYWNRENKLILTTDIGIVTKKSDSDLFVWLNSLSTTSPVPNVTVKVFTKTNQQILQGMADENGLVHFRDVDWSDDKKPFVVTASAGDDLSFIELEKCTLSETDFDIQGRPFLSGGYEGFLYTDRGIYRPGETIHLRAILRGIGVEVPERFPVVFDITRPDARRFKKLNAMLSEFGTADTDIYMPDYALTGEYTVNVLLPGSDEIIGSCKFNVEEFMPDRIKVEVAIPDKRFNVSEVLPINVLAEHFFGAAATERLIEATCDLLPVNFKPDGYSDFVFGDETQEFSKRALHVGEKKSDAQGKANFELKIPEGIMPPSALSASISAVVKELGGRAVTSRAERFVDAYPYYIGIRKTTEGYAYVDEETDFDYIAVSPEGKKIALPELEASIHKVIWSSVLKKDERGKYRYISESREELVLEDTIEPQDTTGKFAFTPKSWGDYIIRIKGKEKGMHVAALKFHCSGIGYMPWAMERPDRVELELDKKTYDTGDTAKLVIKSPFKGKALITISKDEVLSVKTIELVEATQEIPIVIDEAFRPNAYCSVSVIRPIIPEEQWAAHRAYGIIPITLDNSKHKLKVDVDAPDSASPEDKVSVDISVQSTERTQVSVALVDEGVLRLTGFTTPDPFDFFYGKRGSHIATSDIYSLLIPEFDKKKIGADSTPSGDGVAYKRRLIPISAERVKPAVLWKSNVVTDSRGKASVEFTIPEFTGNLRIMVVAAGNKDFGNAQGDMKIVEPLMIKPTIPRFLSVDDEFILPVGVFNTIGKDGEVTVSVETSQGFKIISSETSKVKIKNNAEGIVSFKLKAPSSPQKAEITIRASMDEHSISRTTEFPVRPPAPFTSISGSGAIKAPADQIVKIPGGWLKGTEKYSLLTMSYPALQFAGGLKFLVQYPYGCIEQTTSSVFPMLYLKDIAATVEPERFSGDMIDSYIDAGIQRVLSMQTYKGGFGFWPGTQNIYDWGSVYATDFLIEADNADYAVPNLEMNAALDYLEKILAGKDKDYSLKLKAYSCFVLAKAGRIKASWIRRLQERRDELPAYSRFHLAAALAELGDTKAVSDILGQGLPDNPDAESETGDSINSYVRENALALSVYMDIDPENEMVPVLVKRLEASMKKGSWGTTQDNAMALLGLGKYARFIEGQDVDYSGSISVGEEIIAEFDNESGALIENIDLGGKDVKISVKGKGTAYYYWSAEGVPISGKVEEEDKGIKVRRQFLTRDGSEIDLTKIKQGDIIVVDLSMKAGADYENVIVADLLPACFEIENPRISTRETIEWMKKDIFEPDHIDIRDDRFLMFTELFGGKDRRYRYIIRAVTKGEFALPPISAECMYDPSIKSVHGQGEIKVIGYDGE